MQALFYNTAVSHLMTNKAFDLTDLKKSVRMQESSRSKSISEISKLSARNQRSESTTQESYYLSRWGQASDHKDKQPWVNVGQGICSVAVGEKHTLILNNKQECYVYGSNQYGQLAIEQEQATRPIQLSALRDIKVIGVYCGSYHSFVISSKNDVYAFGLNIKGQLGIGSYESERKPVLVYSLMGRGVKNPQSSFYLETLEYQKRQKAREERRQGLSQLPTFQNMAPSKHTEPAIYLSSDEVIVSISCGPLHSVALSSKGRIFSCGFGKNYCLGHGQPHILNEFKEIKSNIKVEHVQCGLSSTVILSQGKAYIVGKLGASTYKTFTPIPHHQDVRDIKISENNCLILNRKGQLYMFGQITRDSGDKQFADTPRQIEHMASMSCIFGSLAGYFAVSENKMVWGWGNNNVCQITGLSGSSYILSPSVLKIPIYLGQNIKIIGGPHTTYLLSNRQLDLDFEKYEGTDDSYVQEEDSYKKHLIITKKKSSIKMNEKNSVIDSVGLEARTFNHSLQIDFNELVFDKQISEGGYGVIYRGKWRQTTVAIKIFKIESENAVRDFFSQCAAMEALRHPNIVMYLGACTKPPSFAIVLEYCARGSLWSTIQNLEVPLSWEDRRRFALDTAKGVNYLHMCNPPIIHRDLKSLNLLLDDSFRVKLADFGWTKGLDEYMTGKIGTYQWMAPQVIASQKYSEKADVFSFGIILWEIASRQPPYRHLTGVEVSVQVLNNDLRPNIPKKTPEAFVRLMKKCWDREPSRRPSFKEIIKQLELIKF